MPIINDTFNPLFFIQSYVPSRQETCSLRAHKPFIDQKGASVVEMVDGVDRKQQNLVHCFSLSLSTPIVYTGKQSCEHKDLFRKEIMSMRDPWAVAQI